MEISFEMFLYFLNLSDNWHEVLNETLVSSDVRSGKEDSALVGLLCRKLGKLFLASWIFFRLLTFLSQFCV